MPTRRAFVAFVAAFAVGLASPAAAKGKSKLEIASVDFPNPGAITKDREKQITSSIRRLAMQSAKNLDFGPDKVVVTLIVRELSTSEDEGVLKVACTLIGRIKGGGSARSKIAFGGKPDKKKKIEKQVLASVTDGVMIRLAELART